MFLNKSISCLPCKTYLPLHCNTTGSENPCLFNKQTHKQTNKQTNNYDVIAFKVKIKF